MQSPAASRREFRVGAVLSRAIGVYFRHVPTFIVLGAITALPNLFNDPTPHAFDPVALARALLTLFVLYPICQAMVLYAAFQDMRHRPVRLGEIVQKIIARIPIVIGVSICFAFAFGFATILLIVPGFIVFTMYLFAQPVAVVERLGVFGSMKRSAQLTKGHRWRVFGLLMVIMLVGAIFGAIELALLKLSGPLAFQISNFICGALFGSSFSIVFAVAYHDLRVANEGIDIERIAAVFD